MRKWLIAGIVLTPVLVVAWLALPAWLPPVLTFVDANNERLQGISSLLSIVLFLASAASLVATVAGFIRARNSPAPPRAPAAGDDAGGDAGDGDSAARGPKGHIVQVTTGDVAGGTVIAGVEVTVNAAPPDSGDAAALRRSYLGALFKRAGALSLFGVDPSAAMDEQEARLELSAVYTGLRATAPETHDRLERDEMTGRDIQFAPVLDPLNHDKHLVLLGGPGSGKSTFVQFVAQCMAGALLGDGQINLAALTAPLPGDDNADKPQEWQHGALIPVWIVLRDFAANHLPPAGQPATAADLWQHIDSALARDTLEAFAPHLKKELRNTGGLLLLDGLDEVPDAQERREQLMRVVESFAGAYPNCRILVTSRPYAYQNQGWQLRDFAVTAIAPFSQPQIDFFIDRWYAYVSARRHTAEAVAQSRAADLKGQIGRNERLMALARRPLLLTLMASLHAWQQGRLPEDREVLYEQAVELLLVLWERGKEAPNALTGRVERQPSLSEYLNVGRDTVRRLLHDLAFEAHRDQPDLRGTADLREAALVQRLLQLNPGNRDARPARLVEYLSQRSGLLIPRGNGIYTFPHRTFQEFLAACHLANDPRFPRSMAELARADPERWREVALLATARVSEKMASAVWLAIEALCCRDVDPAARPGPADRPDEWGAFLAGQALLDKAPAARAELLADPDHDHTLAPLRRWQLAILQRGRLPAVDRAAAGNALACLGDPRFDPDRWYLPGDDRLGFIPIPAGPFVMGTPASQFDPVMTLAGVAGDQRNNFKDEIWPDDAPLPHLPEYFIGRYPVTVAQFRAFVEHARITVRDKDSLSGIANHPVRGVTWYEAMDYCDWLTERLKESDATPEPLRSRLRREGWRAGLPSEAEWEKAARGGMDDTPNPGRIYTWADDRPSPDRANSDATGIGTTSAVGCFPAGASPYGCLDMLGNTWEWTRSRYQPYTPGQGYDPACEAFTRKSAKDSDWFVVRGGAYFYDASWSRCAHRYWNYPFVWYNYFGFRVVVRSRFSSTSGT